MAKLRINASSLFTKHTLEVTDTGVVWIESTLLGGKERIPFGAIDAVLRGTNSLSFQVRRKTYRIPIKPTDPRHLAAVARLVAGCRQTVPRRQPPVGPARTPEMS